MGYDLVINSEFVVVRLHRMYPVAIDNPGICLSRWRLFGKFSPDGVAMQLVLRVSIVLHSVIILCGVLCRS